MSMHPTMLCCITVCLYIILLITKCFDEILANLLLMVSFSSLQRKSCCFKNVECISFGLAMLDCTCT